jgi:hypothetical protein
LLSLGYPSSRLHLRVLVGQDGCWNDQKH